MGERPRETGRPRWRGAARTALLPLALFGVLGLAAVVLVHEIAEVIVILNGLRAARTRKSIA